MLVAGKARPGPSAAFPRAPVTAARGKCPVSRLPSAFRVRRHAHALAVQPMRSPCSPSPDPPPFGHATMPTMRSRQHRSRPDSHRMFWAARRPRGAAQTLNAHRDDGSSVALVQGTPIGVWTGTALQAKGAMSPPRSRWVDPPPARRQSSAARGAVTYRRGRLDVRPLRGAGVVRCEPALLAGEPAGPPCGPTCPRSQPPYPPSPAPGCPARLGVLGLEIACSVGKHALNPILPSHAFQDGAVPPPRAFAPRAAVSLSSPPSTDDGEDPLPMYCPSGPAVRPGPPWLRSSITSRPLPGACLSLCLVGHRPRPGDPPSLACPPWAWTITRLGSPSADDLEARPPWASVSASPVIPGPASRSRRSEASCQGRIPPRNFG